MVSRNQLTMCRLCLCENQCFINIFKLNDWQGNIAAEVIFDLLQFQVSETDGYPHVVCSTCLVKLTDFKLFKECCQHSKVKYDDMFASSESLVKHQSEMMEFIAVKAEPIYYSDNEDNVSKDIRHGGCNSELCEQVPLGETSSRVELIEAGPSGNLGTVQSTATVLEDSFKENQARDDVTIIKQEKFDIDSTSGDGSEGSFDGSNTEVTFAPILLKCKVLPYNRANHPQETLIVSEASGNIDAVEPLSPSLEDNTKEEEGRVPTPGKQVMGGKGRFECHHCMKVLKSKDALKRHLATHGIGKFFKCEVCPRTFGTITVLMNHQRTHSREKPVSCDICSARFTTNSNLKIHMRIHAGSKPYSCRECNMSFRHTGSLKSHMKLHSHYRPYCCDLCHETFRHKHALMCHVKSRCGIRPYKCDICSKEFTKSASLKHHIVVHTGDRPYSCIHCSKRFRHKGNLRRHLKTVCAGKC